MAKIKVNGEEYNAQDVCVIPKCPTASCARVIEVDNPESKRRDLCFGHTYQMKRVYKDAIEIVATWNGYTMEDF